MKAKTRHGRDAGNAQIFALHEKANEDVVNAYKWLIAQPFADKSRMVVGGGSYGGIQTLMTAAADGTQKLGIAPSLRCRPPLNPGGRPGATSSRPRSPPPPRRSFWRRRATTTIWADRNAGAAGR